MRTSNGHRLGLRNCLLLFADADASRRSQERIFDVDEVEEDLNALLKP